MVHHPSISRKFSYYGLTSSIDILPTCLSLTDVHSSFSSLPGISLAPIIHHCQMTQTDYTLTPLDYSRNIIFETWDDVMEGESNYPLYYYRFYYFFFISPIVLPYL